MKLTLFTLALVSATAQACTPGLYGVGTCAPPVTASGNGDSVTPHIIHALGKCFKDKFGVGPWTFHGLASPDYSGVGNAWGVYKDFGDGVRSRYHHVLLSSKTNERLLRNIFKFDVGNLCSCKQSVDSNILQDLVRKAESG